jgi:hypothetical protein
MPVGSGAQPVQGFDQVRVRLTADAELVVTVATPRHCLRRLNPALDLAAFLYRSASKFGGRPPQHR